MAARYSMRTTQLLEECQVASEVCAQVIPRTCYARFHAGTMYMLYDADDGL